jgi:hypothetical protein
MGIEIYDQKYKGYTVIFVKDTWVKVRRTFWERVFSWTPWIAEKEVAAPHPIRPGGPMMRFGDKLYMHENDKLAFLYAIDVENQKERTGKGEEAPLLADPLSPPRNAGFEIDNIERRIMAHQESAVKHNTSINTGRLIPKSELIKQFQTIRPDPRILSKIKPNGNDDGGTSQT